MPDDFIRIMKQREHFFSVIRNLRNLRLARIELKSYAAACGQAMPCTIKTARFVGNRNGDVRQSASSLTYPVFLD